MAAKKQKGVKSSSTGRSVRPAEMPQPPAAKPVRGRDEPVGGNRKVDERELVRKNAKPRSPRETLKGSNSRKASTSRKG